MFARLLGSASSPVIGRQNCRSGKEHRRPITGPAEIECRSSSGGGGGIVPRHWCQWGKE
ncbi:unnamed protein product [Staurois parvus]|uniref:Uncharacterized protein n=1 Tax=Staurois parvus TaxID=386267 RepID=A0ABN9DGW8_9NEOB|nr:unnamed protein product [Staurois parvus]